MFNKLKTKLKTKLRKWLEIELLEKDFTYYKDKIDRDLFNKENDIQYNSDSIKILHNTVENVVHIGTDVRRHNDAHSWAVVCIEGKMNLVKFVDLNRNNAMDILHFLKQFEGGRNCVDAPCQEMFYDGIFKFKD